MYFSKTHITMTSPVFLRRSPALTPRALSCAVSLCFAACAPALAQEATQTLAPVVVTGARFASDPALLPIGATVISAADIRRAGVSDINQAIRKIGGVYGRQSLVGGPDFELDLRGFGTNSNQNMVVVLDGVRMSENEMASAVLSVIPIDSVERIEIARGGNSVLYGEGATGGVINIVTKRAGRQAGRGSVFAEAGQFGSREVRASVTQSWDGVTLNAAAGEQRTDGYRANSAFKQNNFSGGAQWALKDGRIGLRLDSVRQDARFPGSLSQNQFDDNPRQTLKPNEFGSLDSDQVTAFIERRAGSLDLAAELSHREKTVKSLYVSDSGPSAAKADSAQTQISPRVRHLAQFDGLFNEVAVGVDLIRWNRLSGTDDAHQKSRALYVRDELKFDGAQHARIAIGARHEIFDKDASTYDFSQSQNAWEVQGAYDPLPLLQLYAKGGQSYRVANVDENGYTQAGKPLAGQVSHDLELGGTFGNATRSLTARLFRHNLTNEIFFDPTFYDPTVGQYGQYGANVNLDPTKREGVELEVGARVGADWRVNARMQHVKATFTDGPNSGKEMILVPRNIVSARLSWVPAGGQSADVGVQWVDSQRNGGDFTNSCAARIPAYTTLDARYARKIGAWELAVTGLNLGNEHYYSVAFACKAAIYPADGRQLKVSARYDF